MILMGSFLLDVLCTLSARHVQLSKICKSLKTNQRALKSAATHYHSNKICRVVEGGNRHIPPNTPRTYGSSTAV